MSKVTALFTIALLLFFTLSYAARPDPAFPNDSSMKTQLGEVEVENVEVDGSCEGLGEEECLMRRTLAAHTDYIYTQKENP
ncbi:hypothetical protein HHK36_002778 [Tetracentron sinense]|uniref:Phytosulfokine n=1 Tax=Tetracentron sinense TaxID=13715 RepID=A0A835DN87_TETSI|nr:hypothetical protein HHK36_002778 [Tetracentron sinense]